MPQRDMCFLISKRIMSRRSSIETFRSADAGRCVRLVLALLIAVASQAAVGSPLEVDPANPRYFRNDAGETVFLTGSHTWNNLVDQSKKGVFDYDGYLGFLQARGHNFMRMWTWEHAEVPSADGGRNLFDPSPFQRTGPGTAIDGKPKFDLREFNQGYFDRLRSRVIAAGDRGIYVSVMLFEGWSINGFDTSSGGATPTAWEGHPCHPLNNINGIDGDLNGDGKGYEVHSLSVPAVTELQEDYVLKVIDTLNDLDNVLFEIANESWGASWEWQYHMIQFIKGCEAKKPKQHPVGMTVCGNGPGYINQWIPPAILFNSPADWVSPASNSSYGDYKYNPPAATGGKVILADTDHLWGIGGDATWVWRSVCRGLNPIYMDPMGTDPVHEGPRMAMGRARGYAERIELASATPTADSALCSTTYCLRSPGRQYLVFQPGSGSFSVHLEAGTYDYEWFEVATDSVVGGGAVTVSTGSRTFTPPFSGKAVLFLRVPGGDEPVDVRVGNDASVTSNPAYDVVVDPARNLVHFVYGRAYQSAAAMYSTQSADGGATWTAPEAIPGTGLEPRIAVDSQGTVHLVYGTNTKNGFDESECWYRSRTVDGQWSPAVPLTALPESDGQAYSLMGPRIAVDLQDNVHVIYWKWLPGVTAFPDYLHRMRCVYTRLQAGNTSFDPIQEFAFQRDQVALGGGAHGDLAVDAGTGDLHILYAGFSRSYHSSGSNGWRLNHMIRRADGTWDPQIDLFNAGVSDFGVAIDVDAEGVLHVAAFHQRDPDPNVGPKYWAYYTNAADPAVLELVHYIPDDWSIVVDLEEVDGSVFLSRANCNGQNLEPWRALTMHYDAVAGEWSAPAALSPAGARNSGYRHGGAPKFAVLHGNVSVYYAAQAPGDVFKFYQRHVLNGGEGRPPSVDAGPNLEITFPENTVQLDGTVTDDGLPEGGTLTTTWSLVSGPGAVVFGDAASVDTTAAFSAGGTYVLRLSANDGAMFASDIATITVLAPRDPENPPDVVNGLLYEYYEGTWDALPDFATMTPVAEGTCAGFSLADRLRDESFGFRFTGYIDIPTQGRYTFSTQSDDGSALYIGATKVVDNDGLHAVVEAAGAIDLKAGKHAVTVVFFEKSGGESLAVLYEGPGVSKQAIPPAALYCAGQNPVNTPPSVAAGSDQLVVMHSPAVATLDGSVADDGLPNPPGGCMTTWSKLGGPGPVVFGDAECAATTATFTEPGLYTLRLTVCDGDCTASDDVQVEVVAPQAAAPEIVPNGGSFQDSVEVEITTSTAGAEIRYTTDGADPSPTATLYAGPFSLENSATVKAQAYLQGYRDSDVSAADFVIDASPGDPVYGTAVSLDGIDDTVEMPTVSAEFRSFSVEFWLRPSSRKDWNQNIKAGGGWGQFVFHTTALGGIYAGTDVATRFTPRELPTGSLQLGDWQHFVYVFDNGQARLYRNGVMLAAKVQSHPARWDGFRVGVPYPSFDVDGAVDELRIYNCALTATEVQAHYNGGQGLYGEPETGLFAGWHFDNAAGTATEDYSGNGHHGVLLNGATWTQGIVGGPEEPPTPKLAAPSIVPEGGTFEESVDVTLFCEAGEAEIRYTLDGNDPSTDSAVYSDSLTLTESCIVKARAFCPGYIESDIVAASFTVDPAAPEPVTGQALSFDGVDDVVEMPTVAGQLTAFAVEFWLLPRSHKDWNQNVSAGSGWGQFVFHTTVDGAIYAGTDLATRFSARDLPAGSLVLDQWQHFAYVFDNGQASLYRNGSLLASKPQAFPAAWTGLRVGNSAGTCLMHGALDELRVYMRALSPGEVAEHFNGGLGEPGVPEAGLLAGWHFDEGDGAAAADFSGNGHDALLVNGTAWEEGRVEAPAEPVALGGALMFDGEDDLVEVPTLVGELPSFAVEFWLKPSSRKNWNQNVTAAGGWGQFVFHADATGAIYAGTDMLTRFSPYTLPSGTLLTQQWQHFAYVYEAGQGRFYRNGVLLASKNQTPPTAWTGFRMGIPSTRYNLDGGLDEVRVYERALSDAEVEAHYNEGRGQQGVAEPGLVAGWHFDETDGAVAYDYSGNGHDGTLLNGCTRCPGLVALEDGDRDRGLAPGGEPTSQPGSTRPDDVDGDGLLDTWEELVISDLGDPEVRTLLELRPIDDLDRDGLVNSGEFHADTDPLDPESVFRVLAVGRNAQGEPVVQFTCRNGKTYQILHTDGDGPWQTLDTFAATEDGVAEWSHAGASAANQRGFYAAAVVQAE